jgi:hypothetical protein
LCEIKRNGLRRAFPMDGEVRKPGGFTDVGNQWRKSLLRIGAEPEGFVSGDRFRDFQITEAEGDVPGRNQGAQVADGCWLLVSGVAASNTDFNNVSPVKRWPILG